MSRRKKIIITLVALLVLILLLYLAWFYFGRGQTPSANAPVNTGATSSNNQEVKLPATTPSIIKLNSGNGQTAIKAPSLEDNLKKLAINFAERYGSFSNQNLFQNIIDLAPLMSVKMKAYSEQSIAAAKPQNTSVYSGTTTKAIRASLASLNEGKGQAEVIVSTQRFIATSSTDNITKVYYQDISIKFILEDGEWRIDGAYWK